VPVAISQISENEFYQSFANYLVTDLEECTKAIPLGNNIFRDKWGTPDVIGIEESKPSDIVKHETIIVFRRDKNGYTRVNHSFWSSLRIQNI
jgi:hypothetical protein